MILLAGRMVPQKGILEFSKALAEVVGQHPEWERRHRRCAPFRSK